MPNLFVIMLDYLTMRELAFELSERVTNLWIRKIFHASSFELILHFGKDKNLILNLQSGKGHLRLDADLEKSFTSPFLLLAKKHLENTKIISCELMQGEKILVLSTFKHQLVVELPGIKNRMFLLNDARIILGSWPYFETDLQDERFLEVNAPYVEPSPQPFHLFSVSEKSLKESWSTIYSGQDKRWWGLNKLHWKNLRTYDEVESLKLFLKIRSEKSFSPAVVDEGISLIPPKNASSALGSKSVLEAIRLFYTRDLKKVAFEKRKKEYLFILKNALQKKQKKYQQQVEALREAQGAEKIKHYGDLILTYAHDLSTGHETLQIPGVDESIPLDPKRDGVRNAEAYYKRYKKEKTRRTLLGSEIQKSEKAIRDLEELETWGVLAEEEAHLDSLSQQIKHLGFLTEKDVGKRRVQERAPYLQRTLSDQSILFIGRNDKENVEVLRHAKGEDLWFHAKDIPGGHVILRSAMNNFSEESIVQAAETAAYYSKGRNWDKVPIDYCPRKEVRSIPGAKAHVTFQNAKTLLVPPHSLT